MTLSVWITIESTVESKLFAHEHTEKNYRYTGQAEVTWRCCINKKASSKQSFTVHKYRYKHREQSRCRFMD